MVRHDPKLRRHVDVAQELGVSFIRGIAYNVVASGPPM